MAEQQQQPQLQLASPQKWTPKSRKIVKFMVATTIGAVLLGLSALTLTGTAIALIIATPVLLLLSPVLVPSGIILFLIITGFLFSGGFSVLAIAAVAWIYNYVTGKHPMGADQLDYARRRVANKARDVKERAKEYGEYVQHKAQEVTNQESQVVV